MVSLPQTGVLSQYSYSLQQQQSLLLKASAQQKEGAATVHVQATSSNTVTLTGRVSGSATYEPPLIAKPQNAESSPRTQAATNILSFIALRLESDAAEGATAEELEARLNEGLQGFLQGYQEAYDQLAGAGLLGPEVEEAIETTYSQVLAGIDELAERFGVTIDTSAARQGEAEGNGSSGAQEPVVEAPSEPVDIAALSREPDDSVSRMIEAANINYERISEREFAFKLKTQDGDEVTIYATSQRDESASFSALNFADDYSAYRAGRVEAQTSEENGFYLRVKGNLDESELTAIGDLLAQVGDISQSFFSGNISDAFDMALNIGFDESEIAQFSLNLRQSVTTKVEETYATISQQDDLLDKNKSGMPVDFANGKNSLARLAKFVEMLQDAVSKAEKLGIEREVIPHLAGRLAEIDKAPRLTDMLERLVRELPSKV